MNEGLVQVLNRHTAFWEMTEVDRPLVAISRGHPFTYDDFDWGGQSEGELLPSMIDVQAFLDQYEIRFSAGDPLEGDAFWVGEPMRVIPWMEAIMGCRVRFSAASRSVWAEPALESWEDLDHLREYLESPWLKLAVDLTRGLVELSAERFPVVMLLQRGPLDVAVALRGLERLCLDVYDHPEEVERLLGLCSEANLHVAQALGQMIPAHAGGHCNYFGLWAPGWPYLHQQDAMASFSPRAYAQFVRSSDDELLGAFDHSIRKFHSSSLQVLDDATGLAAVRGVQITVDPTGPTLDDLIPVFRRVQRRLPLLVNCTSQETANTLANALEPKGLFLYYWETAEGLAKLNFTR